VTAEEKLAGDVRAHLSSMGVISEVKMFGGLGFMLNGNLVAAVSKRGLLLRVGKDRQNHALARPAARPMEMRGRTIEGYVYVDPMAIEHRDLQAWLDEAATFVQTLPPKAASRKSVRKGKRT
jgi:TfoX/Sxy family transcriptional regulator of competence genes